MKRRAYINVYDKTGLEDFARNLVEKFNYEIVSSGETYELLKKSGIEVTNAASFSGCPSILSGEFNALNEAVFAGILANSTDTEELSDIEKLAIKPFDMVVVNFKPTAQIAAEELKEVIESIDIVGCALLRAGAKNYKNVTVICDKIDYYVALNANDFGRQKLAVKAFNILSNYDRLISTKLGEDTGETLFKSFTLEKIKDMDYGENSHQKAALYRHEKTIDYEVIDNKELTYNNIINLKQVVDIAAEFHDVNAVAVVRHAKPCGVALGRSIYDAYTKAFDCDPLSAFNGTVGFSKPVDLDVAKHIGSMSVKLIAAPGFEPKALELLKENRDLKLVQINTSLDDYKKAVVDEVLMTPFGTLIQGKNDSSLGKDSFKIVTKIKPTAEQIEDAIFAWNAVKYAKTNSCVIARDFKTLAIAQGCTNSLSAIEVALNYACDGSKDAVLASDDILLSEDSIYIAAQARIGLIIQPGGALKDQSLIEIADKYNIAMILTGIKNLKT